MFRVRQSDQGTEIEGISATVNGTMSQQNNFLIMATHIKLNPETLNPKL